MKFICRYENKRTHELRDQICVLDPDEIAEVERARETEGDEIAQLTAAAIVLTAGYRDLDAFSWHHTHLPKPLD